MSVVATALRELMALGVSGDALVAAVERIEAAATLERATTVREAVEIASRTADAELSARQARNRRYYENKRLKASESKTIKTDQDVSGASKTLSDGAAPRTCAQVEDTSSSLRSEDIPPEKPSVSTPKGGEKRGERIPESWTPDFEAALKVGLGREDAQVEADKFRDYWRAVPGAKGRKTDWPATWRNWCRTAAENRSRRAPHERPHHDAKFDARQANLTRAFAASERTAGPRWEP